MSAPVPLRDDFSADDLRRLARASRDAGQSRRLLALATIYEGASRMDAVRTGAVGLRTVRDWVLAFIAAGPAGLTDRKAPGQRQKRDAAQRQALAQVIEEGPDPNRHGVVRWRLKDLAAWVYASFGFSLKESTVGRTVKALGFAKLSARPRHHAQDPAALAAFKKACPLAYVNGHRSLRDCGLSKFPDRRVRYRSVISRWSDRMWPFQVAGRGAWERAAV